MTAKFDYSDPFLIVVHVSDMHIVHNQFMSHDSRRVRLGKRIVRQVKPELWGQGTAESDPAALIEFKKFLESKVNRYYPDSEKWIVDTGDLSNWGDDDSISLARSTLVDFGNIVGAKKLITIYGNHDSWPGQHPLFSNSKDLISHREKLREKYYNDMFPQGPHSISIPLSNSEIQLFSLNSVIHTPKITNLKALGEIEEDMYWKKVPPKKLKNEQLKKLHNLVESSQYDSGSKHLRMVLTHHPVHFPNGKPKHRMHLINDVAVAKFLSSGVESAPEPHFKLVLSGHTHSPFPAVGKLQDDIANCNHNPLNKGQCQFVIGSLSQKNFSGNEGPYYQQAQILAFHTVNNNPETVAIERRIVARSNGVGEYLFVPTSNTSNPSYSEIIHISL